MRFCVFLGCLSVVSYCFMIVGFLTSLDYLIRSSFFDCFSLIDLCCQFLVDCFVLGCLDWSRLFTLFWLELVL